MSDHGGVRAFVRRRSSTTLVVVLTTSGFLLLQLAWVASVPPYRGVDEFDHAYRAAAVARGEVVADPSEATRGTGAEVAVPRDIVEAANPVCESYDYTSTGDCNAIAVLDGDMVSVASGAGRYNPTYYAVPGVAGLPFDGYIALYAMRIASALMCATLFALAAWSATVWRRSGHVLAGFLVATTPVLVYSTAIVAPNGLEMVAAMALWCALLGLISGKASAEQRRILVGVATLAACVLLTVRSLGPLWLAGIVVTVAFVAAWGPRAWLVVVGRRSTAGAASLVGGAAAAGVAWSFVQHSLVVGKEEGVRQASFVQGLGEGVASVALWVLQGAAAFPARLDSAPPLVYMAALALLALLLAHGTLRGDRRSVIAAWAVGIASLLIPIVITARTFNDYGVAWQGRYGLPLAMGLPLLMGFALERASRRARLSLAIVLPAAVLWGIAHGVGVTSVLQNEVDTSPLSGTGAWSSPPAPAVIALVVLGVAMWTAAVVLADRRDPGPDLVATPVLTLDTKAVA